MKKILFALSMVATLVVCGDPGYKKFGTIKSTENIVTGIEAGNGVEVIDQYKISTTNNPGMSGYMKTIDSSFVNDDYVKVLEETIGMATAKCMHIYGHPRHSMVVTNFVTELDYVIIHQPTNKEFGSKQWFLEYIEKAAPTNNFTLLYNLVEDGNITNEIYKTLNIGFEPGQSYSGTNGWISTFHDVGDNTFVAESIKMSDVK